MIQEDLIQYETAVLAKSKGFDIPCFEYYEKEIPELYYSNREEEEPYDNEKYIDTFGEDLYEYIFSAPTQSLLAKWLRVNHNINVLISYQPAKIVNETYYWYVIVNNNIEHDDWQERFNNILDKSYENLSDVSDELFQKYLFEDKFAFSTYEECFEYALQEALKLI